jgi:hypothetical protein
MSLLNEAQKRSLLVSLLEIHRLMADMEAMIAECEKPSPFSRYIDDLASPEKQSILAYFARLRAAVLDSLRECGIPLEIRRTSARWSLQCCINYMEIAIAEFGAKGLRAYGPVNPSAEPQLAKVQRNLGEVVGQLGSYLREGAKNK